MVTRDRPAFALLRERKAGRSPRGPIVRRGTTARRGATARGSGPTARRRNSGASRRKFQLGYFQDVRTLTLPSWLTATVCS